VPYGSLDVCGPGTGTDGQGAPGTLFNAEIPPAARDGRGIRRPPIRRAPRPGPPPGPCSCIRPGRRQRRRAAVRREPGNRSWTSSSRTICQRPEQGLQPRLPIHSAELRQRGLGRRPANRPPCTPACSAGPGPAFTPRPGPCRKTPARSPAAGCHDPGAPARRRPGPARRGPGPAAPSPWTPLARHIRASPNLMKPLPARACFALDDLATRVEGPTTARHSPRPAAQRTRGCGPGQPRAPLGTLTCHDDGVTECGRFIPPYWPLLQMANRQLATGRRGCWD